jgi:hypothetical protein
VKPVRVVSLVTVNEQEIQIDFCSQLELAPLVDTRRKPGRRRELKRKYGRACKWRSGTVLGISVATNRTVALKLEDSRSNEVERDRRVRR